MALEVTVTIKNGKGEPKSYLLTQTGEPKLNEKNGKTTLAHFQPASDSKVVKPFSKLYIDTEELKSK